MILRPLDEFWRKLLTLETKGVPRDDGNGSPPVETSKYLCMYEYEYNYLMCRVWQALGAHETIFQVNDMPQFWLKSGLDPKLWW